MLPKTNHWVPWDFKIQILSNPMESYGFHEILRLNLVKSNGIFWVPWDFKTQILSNPTNGIWWVPWGFNYQILSNPKESDGFHEVLPIKSFQIQWNLMGSMRFYLSNLFKSKGIWWVPWDYDNQILSNPKESDGFHEIMTIKSYQISSYPKFYVNGSEGAYY